MAMQYYPEVKKLANGLYIGKQYKKGNLKDQWGKKSYSVSGPRTMFKAHGEK